MTIPQAFDLALQHHKAGQLASAEALYLQILAAQPNHIDSRHFLGIIAHQTGRHDDAVTQIRRAILLDPNNPAAHSNLGEAYRAMGLLGDAIGAYREALRLNPDSPQAYSNLGIALREQGLPDEAIASYRRALELKPDYPEAHNNLANALMDQGSLDEALSAYRRALQFGPENPRRHSNLIYTLLFHPDHDAGTTSDERLRWNRQFGDPLKPSILPHANDRTVERTLRIGYVSPDLRDHVVGRNLLPLFRCHDRRHFEILCYSGVVLPDHLTDEFRRHTQLWRSTLGVGEAPLAEMIRQDRVDILVDLSQHMAGNRLSLFARKPAPVQVSFAGYPEGSGLEAIGSRISDRYLEIGRLNDGQTNKEQLHLIDSFWCYDPCGAQAVVNGLPAKETGYLTFACPNNFCKVNDSMLRIWARVLRMVKNSRIVLLSRIGSHRNRTLEIFAKEGVESQRVEFLDFFPRRAYLELYHRLDIVLDTFPYNGHSTNLDALWMGVPVISLPGKTPVSRAGLSQLTNLGLSELVAHSEEDYVRIAVDLAGDLPRLGHLRSTLRARMENSILMDAPGFTRQVEQAYRSMWERWCATGG